MGVCSTTFLDPVTLTLQQGQVTMYGFWGLIIIHHHATFGEDRFNSVREKSNVKVFNDAWRTTTGQYIDSLCYACESKMIKTHMAKCDSPTTSEVKLTANSMYLYIIQVRGSPVTLTLGVRPTKLVSKEKAYCALLTIYSHGNHSR
jgi:hypothetical protein